MFTAECAKCNIEMPYKDKKRANRALRDCVVCKNCKEERKLSLPISKNCPQCRQ